MPGDITTNLIYVAAGVLLPLIPAYVLYKTLPARENYGGPLGMSMKLKLKGASVGYFALVIIVFLFLYTRQTSCPAAGPCPECPKQRYTVYTVSGRLAPIPGVDSFAETNLTLRPRVEILSDGVFLFEVPVDKDTASIRSLEITHQGFKPETIPLTETPPFDVVYPVKYDDQTKRIRIEKDILLKKIPPYSGGTELQENKP